MVTKLNIGDIIQIGNEKAIYCGVVESRVKGHHRLLIYSRDKYQIQYVTDGFFKNIKQKGCVIHVIGTDKMLAEKYKKQEEARKMPLRARF